MNYDWCEMENEYDALLLKPDKSYQDEARISAIEAEIMRRFGFSLRVDCAVAELDS